MLPICLILSGLSFKNKYSVEDSPVAFSSLLFSSLSLAEVTRILKLVFIFPAHDFKNWLHVCAATTVHRVRLWVWSCFSDCSLVSVRLSLPALFLTPSHLSVEKGGGALKVPWPFCLFRFLLCPWALLQLLPAPCLHVLHHPTLLAVSFSSFILGGPVLNESNFCLWPRRLPSSVFLSLFRTGKVMFLETQETNAV